MSLGFEENLQYFFALGGFFKTFLFKMREKNFLFLLHHSISGSAENLLLQQINCILALPWCFGYSCDYFRNLLAFAFELAKVAELADAPDLGSGAVRCGGSSPPFRTISSYRLVSNHIYSEEDCFEFTSCGCQFNRLPERAYP